MNAWAEQYEETAADLHAAGNYRAADDIRTLVDGLKQVESENKRLTRELAEAKQAEVALLVLCGDRQRPGWTGGTDPGEIRAAWETVDRIRAALAGGVGDTEELGYRERPMTEDFYLDPNGQWVYRWRDERVVVVAGGVGDTAT